MAQSKGQDVADVVQVACGTNQVQDRRARCSAIKAMLKIDRAENSPV